MDVYYFYLFLENDIFPEPYNSSFEEKLKIPENLPYLIEYGIHATLRDNDYNRLSDSKILKLYKEIKKFN